VICNAATALVGPQQYDYGLAAVQLIKSGEQMSGLHANLNYWISVWSGFAMIVNRKTPFHRDPGAAAPCYDLLVSGGTHTDCKLEMPDLGATVSYNPGTAVAVTGKVLRHGVRSWSGGERICQAHFMKDSVHDHLGLPRPSWVNYDDYISMTE